jgi:hypothetical protein
MKASLSIRPFWALSIAALVLLAPRAASAQAADRSIELFGGYSYLRDPGSSVIAITSNDDEFRVGWSAGAALPVWRALAAVADVSGHYKTRTTLEQDVRLSFHAFMAGPRASIKVGRFEEFAQALAGVVRARGSAFGETVTLTALSLQPGGGVDYPIASRLRARVQLDYRWIHGADNRQPAHQFRATAALVVR